MEYEFASFIHDRQNEFGASIKETCELMKKVNASYEPQSLITDIELVETINCPINIVSSDQSFGLQMIDIALWLMKKYPFGNLNGFDGCKTLANYIIKNSRITDLTLESIKNEVSYMKNKVMTKNLTEEEVMLGRKLVEDIDRSRYERMLNS